MRPLRRDLTSQTSCSGFSSAQRGSHRAPPIGPHPSHQSGACSDGSQPLDHVPKDRPGLVPEAGQNLRPLRWLVRIRRACVAAKSEGLFGRRASLDQLRGLLQSRALLKLGQHNRPTHGRNPVPLITDASARDWGCAALPRGSVTPLRPTLDSWLGDAWRRCASTLFD